MGLVTNCGFINKIMLIRTNEVANIFKNILNLSLIVRTTTIKTKDKIEALEKVITKIPTFISSKTIWNLFVFLRNRLQINDKDVNKTNAPKVFWC